MGILEYFNRSPFRELIGIEITEAAGGYAEGRLPLERKHSSNRQRLVAQGGVAFTLLDSVGGAAAVSLCERPTPTVDFHVDYLEPATRDLRATGEVVRDGADAALVDAEVRDDDGTLVARGRGLYKTSDLPDAAPWELDGGGA